MSAFINNNILTKCLRPQPPYQCSANAVAMCLNMLLGGKLEAKDVIGFMHWGDLVGKGKIGNGGVTKAIVQMSGETLAVSRINNSDELWEKCTSNSINGNVMILHEINHYTIICGFIRDSKHIVIAEQSPPRGPLIRLMEYQELVKIINTADKYCIMNVARRQLSIRKDISDHRNIMAFSSQIRRNETYQDIANQTYNCLRNLYANSKLPACGPMRVVIHTASPILTLMLLLGPDGSSFVFRKNMTNGKEIMSSRDTEKELETFDLFDTDSRYSALFLPRDKHVYNSVIKGLQVFSSEPQE